MYNTIAIEDLNKPAVALCNEGFASDARSAASGRGMPGLRVVPENTPTNTSVIEEIEMGINGAIDDIVAALTCPLSPEESSPPAKELQKASGIVFGGSLQEVNRFFYRRGWTDGLPIIPPTEEAVVEMLTGTDLPPDHMVTKIIPRLGKATVEKIAVNAVMAGALPTYMPVLIAGVRALMDSKTWFGIYEVSTGSWVPFWIVNGPVRKDLEINSGAGALSPGNIANATIGRALGLIVKNIGGARKGVEDMGVLGNPGKYAAVIAENEEDSPWEPLHVQEGLEREDSAISLFFPNSFAQIPAYGPDHKDLLNTLIYNVPPGKRDGLTCVMLNPAHAASLASSGWTKDDITRFIAEYARVPAHRHPNSWPVMYSGRYMLRQRPPLNPEESMSIIGGPEKIRVVVAGGPGSFVGIGLGGTMPCEWVTKKVELPANWDRLVEKFRHVAPTCVGYSG
ncbi:MAG: hypothetical protein HY675_21455 [Chloroflexi bacterium]|nr:hypothetical protein [Chloroflexota bacterium]